jgi:hypothetical protein
MVGLLLSVQWLSPGYYKHRIQMFIFRYCLTHYMVSLNSIGGCILDFAVSRFKGIAVFQPVINGKFQIQLNLNLVLHFFIINTNSNLVCS